jgi:AcrR family transcriptional regulator
MDCFLNDDCHRVSTRQVAAKADTNIAMIRYYFGSKEGLYKEMIRQALQPLDRCAGYRASLHPPVALPIIFAFTTVPWLKIPVFPPWNSRCSPSTRDPVNALSINYWSGDEAEQSSV